MPRSQSASQPVSKFQEPFISTLDSASPINAQDDPNYYSRYPRSLLTTCDLDHFMTGTGSAIYKALIPLLESTNHELILVTCFWARSDSLDTLSQVLRTLSNKAVHRGTDKIRVRLCFSSSSLFQKLFHSQKVEGQPYPPEKWVKQLGLPDPKELGGLDLKIKSIFLLPFSVMHPKFIIIDRNRVVLPSCNISWEEWFEGALSMRGKIVDQFLHFYFSFWERKSEIPKPTWQAISGPPPAADPETDLNTPLLLSHTALTSTLPTPSLFLPSPHRRNPNLRPFTPTPRILAPPTPLNVYLLTLFHHATTSIRIQTPNLTAPPVLAALLSALARGVDVAILTSARLMILEQLVTAGTTTSRCLKTLVKRYRRLANSTAPRRPATDEEAALPRTRLGRLQVAFFEPVGGSKKRGQEAGEPQQSHFKMTVVDGEVAVVGSGNLDRASWFTSQELGVAVVGREVVASVVEAVDGAVEGRKGVVFDSGTG